MWPQWYIFNQNVPNRRQKNDYVNILTYFDARFTQQFDKTKDNQKAGSEVSGLFNIGYNISGKSKISVKSGKSKSLFETPLPPLKSGKKSLTFFFWNCQTLENFQIIPGLSIEGFP